MPTYRNLLADGDWQTRVAAATILTSCCGEMPEVVSNALLEALAVEQDDRARFGLLLRLGDVASNGAADALRLIKDKG